MNSRKVNISFMHNAALAGMEAALCHSLDIEKIQYHDDLIFTSMLQAGIKNFHITGHESRFLKSDFLKNKVEFYAFDNYHQLHEKVKNVFSGSECSEDISVTLSWFLTELIHCLNTNTSMVTALPIPKLTAYSGKISLNN